MTFAAIEAQGVLEQIAPRVLALFAARGFGRLFSGLSLGLRPIQSCASSTHSCSRSSSSRARPPRVLTMSRPLQPASMSCSISACAPVEAS